MPSSWTREAYPDGGSVAQVHCGKCNYSVLVRARPHKCYRGHIMRLVGYVELSPQKSVLVEATAALKAEREAHRAEIAATYPKARRRRGRSR